MITTQKRHFYYGILFTFFLASLGYLLALLPLLNRVGPLAIAILLAIIYRQFFNYPAKLHDGIQFTSRYILRFAIILYGLKLNMNIIFQDGLSLVLKSSIVILFSVVLMMIIGKILKADKQLTFLLGIGTGICGAAAIAAVAPLTKAKNDETAMSIAIIALIGTVFSLFYALLLPIIPLTNTDYGIWSGLSLHELAHVALAAEPAGEEALAMALLAKLTRVFLLVPFCFILILWLKTRKHEKNNGAKVSFPYFLFGFIGMSLFGTYILGTHIPMPISMTNFISGATTFLLASAMVGLGLNVNITSIKERALRPFIAICLVSVVLTLTTFLIFL